MKDGKSVMRLKDTQMWPTYIEDKFTCTECLCPRAPSAQHDTIFVAPSVGKIQKTLRILSSLPPKINNAIMQLNSICLNPRSNKFKINLFISLFFNIFTPSFADANDSGDDAASALSFSRPYERAVDARRLLASLPSSSLQKSTEC